jgi:Holliday junction resolvasome RuvABC endonuclease subunit
VSGVKKLLHDKKSSGARFQDFRNWLIETMEAHDIGHVFFERVYGHKGTAAAHVYGGFMYMLAAVCNERHIECAGIPVGTIKKFATGSGSATKAEMIAFAERCGFNPIDDNAADALAILFAGVNTLEAHGDSRYFLAKVGNGAATPDSFLASEIPKMLTNGLRSWCFILIYQLFVLTL